MQTQIVKADVDWADVKNSCRVTDNADGVGAPPTDAFKRKLMISEHSPICAMTVTWLWTGIMSWVATHFVRHWVGWLKWVSTQRNDRQSFEDRNTAPQSQPVNMKIKATAQALINVARKRLCYKASPETREYTEDLKITIHDTVDPYIANVMVPNCIYRAGCPEFTMCENQTWVKFRNYCAEYNHPIDTIQQRYDAYNLWFQDTRK